VDDAGKIGLAGERAWSSSWRTAFRVLARASHVEFGKVILELRENQLPHGAQSAVEVDGAHQRFVRVSKIGEGGRGRRWIPRLCREAKYLPRSIARARRHNVWRFAR